MTRMGCFQGVLPPGAPVVEIEMLGTEIETPGRETETPGTETGTLGTGTGGRLGALGGVAGGLFGDVGRVGVSSAGGAGGVGAGVDGSGADELLVGAPGPVATAPDACVPAPSPADVSGVLAFGFLDTGLLRSAGAETCTVLRVRRRWV